MRTRARTARWRPVTRSMAAVERPAARGLLAQLLQPLPGPGELVVGVLDDPLAQRLAGLPGHGVELGLQLLDGVGQVQCLLGVGVDQLQHLALDGGAFGGESHST